MKLRKLVQLPTKEEFFRGILVFGNYFTWVKSVLLTYFGFIFTYDRANSLNQHSEAQGYI
jgi:hypothetical protein